jgi:hypothetical protein
MPWQLSGTAWLYQRAVASFHAEPHRGVPGGRLRTWIGRPPLTPGEMKPPPKKPSPAWSKLSPWKSSTAAGVVPVPIHGLISSSTNMVTFDVVWWQ